MLVRLAIGLATPSPWILPDELLYTELARAIADGGLPAVRGDATLGWGVVYPLLIAPAWALFSDPVAAYHASLVVNAVVMSLAAVPAYLLARLFVPATPSLLVAAGSVLTAVDGADLDRDDRERRLSAVSARGLADGADGAESDARGSGAGDRRGRARRPRRACQGAVLLPAFLVAAGLYALISPAGGADRVPPPLHADGGRARRGGRAPAARGPRSGGGGGLVRAALGDAAVRASSGRSCGCCSTRPAT